MIARRNKRISAALLVLSGMALFSISSCASSGESKLNPDTAKQFLRLRGYTYDEASFLAAAKANDVAGVNAFLAAGMNPNVQDPDTLASPLISAAGRGSIQIVRTLLNGGADVNAKDRGGYNAILRALETPSDDVAELLLAQPRLDLNAQGLSGVTILMRYVALDREEMVRKVLEQGARVDLQDSDGDSALHRAAQQGNVKIIELLVAKGANPNTPNKVGGTPLMWAAVFGYEPAARTLLNLGANALAKDRLGKTASAWATENGRDEVAEFLKSAEKVRK